MIAIQTNDFITAKFRNADLSGYIDSIKASDNSADSFSSASGAMLTFGAMNTGPTIWNYGHIDVRCVKIFN